MVHTSVNKIGMFYQTAPYFALRRMTLQVITFVIEMARISAPKTGTYNQIVLFFVHQATMTKMATTLVINKGNVHAEKDGLMTATKAASLTVPLKEAIFLGIIIAVTRGGKSALKIGMVEIARNIASQVIMI